MTSRKRPPDLDRLEAVRQACFSAAADAYEDAGLRGLCGDGRWAVALDAIRMLDLGAVVDSVRPAGDPDGILLKRVYEPAAADDGLRVLVDRVWPRGVRRDALALDAWMPEVAPSAALRRWFGHQPSRWAEFQHRFAAELDARPVAVAALASLIRGQRATLLFAARDVERNQAVVLRDYLRRHPGV